MAVLKHQQMLLPCAMPQSLGPPHSGQLDSLIVVDIEYHTRLAAVFDTPHSSNRIILTPCQRR